MVEPCVQPLPPLLAFGQMLEQQSTRGPFVAALLGRQADEAWDLLRLREIALSRIAEALALERHDALVTLLRNRLIEGDGEIALAEHLRQRRTVLQLLDARGIVPVLNEPAPTEI